MKRSYLLLAGLAPLILSSMPVIDSPWSLSRLAWMAGCWESRVGDRVVEEQWMRPEITDSSAVFSNPDHDFPQRIIYLRGADGDSLWARIEGEIGGSAREAHFRYGRVECLA